MNDYDLLQSVVIHYHETMYAYKYTYITKIYKNIIYLTPVAFHEEEIPTAAASEIGENAAADETKNQDLFAGSSCCSELLLFMRRRCQLLQPLRSEKTLPPTKPRIRTCLLDLAGSSWAGFWMNSTVDGVENLHDSSWFMMMKIQEIVFSSCPFF